MIKNITVIIIVLSISGTLAVAGSQGSVYVPRLPLFAICAGIGFLLHWLVFIPSYYFQTEHYFDLTGSLSYVTSVAIAAVLHPLLDIRGLVICVLISIWAVRLGSFLYFRIKKAGQDRRFIELKTNFWRFLVTWTIGGAWVFITSAAALAAITSMTQRPLGLWFIFGLALWIIGFMIEIKADREKTQFRSNEVNRDKFISTGLWKYSRHPNYFGEIILWMGIALIAFPTLVGWQFATLISPVFVTFLLVKVSGVKLLEEGAQRRWGSDANYQDYVAKTSMLIPLPNRDLTKPES